MRFGAMQLGEKHGGGRAAGKTIPAALSPVVSSGLLSLPRTPRSARWTIFGFLIAVASLLLFGNRVAAFYTDWLWFQSQGRGDVWRTIYQARLILFAVFGSASFLLAYLNVRMADNFSPSAIVTLPIVFSPSPRPRVVWGIGGSVNGLPLGRTLQFIAGFRGVLDRLLLTGALLFAIAAGLSAQAEWNSYLRYRHPVLWGQEDPLFHQDIGFYVFTLPWLRYVQGWLLTIFLLLGAGVTVVYLYQQGINWISEHHAQVHAQNQSPGGEKPHFLSPIPPPVRAHLSALLFGVLLAKGFGYYLDRYDLLYGGDWLPGAGYTDVHVRLPMLHGALIVVGIASLVALVNVWRRGVGLPLVALALWLGYSGLGVLIPGWVQRISVQPNELAWETPFLQRAIDATRAGYGLDTIQVHSLAASPAPADTATRSAALWENVPLWEPGALLSRFEQDQPVPQWEQIAAVHLDRYPLAQAGRLQTRTVALGVHELVRDGLEGTAQTWLSRHLRYTHGSGITACFVGGSDATNTSSDSGERVQLSDGAPRYLSSGSNASPVYLTSPQIYFGAEVPDDNYVLINTQQPEVEAQEAQIQPHRDIEAKVGLPLTPLARVALTARFGTWSLLLSHDTTPRTRLLLLRSVSEQVKRYAPFLLLDSAPHPVVYEGRIHWLVTGYTTTSAYPNSALTLLSDNLSPPLSVNYVRPAVVADVDAITGQVRLFAADARVESDPILRSYQACFPGVIRSASEMPSTLRAHRRYPLGLLTLQRQMLAQYHTTDPATFYSRSEVWEVPREARREKPSELESILMRYDSSFLLRNGEQEDSVPVPPYFSVAQLVSDTKALVPEPEFVLQTSLLLPARRVLSGSGRLAGVLIGRSDGPAWGTLQWYATPRDARNSFTYLSASAMSDRFQQAARQTGTTDLMEKPDPPDNSSASKQLPPGVTTVGPVRLTLVSGYLFYVQSVFAGSGAAVSSVGVSDASTSGEDATGVALRLWRVRVSDGIHLTEAETVQDALKILTKKK